MVSYSPFCATFASYEDSQEHSSTVINGDPKQSLVNNIAHSQSAQQMKSLTPSAAQPLMHLVAGEIKNRREAVKDGMQKNISRGSDIESTSFLRRSLRGDGFQKKKEITASATITRWTKLPVERNPSCWKTASQAHRAIFMQVVYVIYAII